VERLSIQPINLIPLPIPLLNPLLHKWRGFFSNRVNECGAHAVKVLKDEGRTVPK